MNEAQCESSNERNPIAAYQPKGRSAHTADAATLADYHQPVPAQNIQVEFDLGDILANAITHGVGAVLAIAGAVYLIVASTRGSAWVIVSCSVFAGTLVLVYLCSTLYHSLVRTRARPVLQILDHSSIYLLIAGTYTPFTLVTLRGPLGWWVFGVEWALAVAGVLSKCLAMERFKSGRLAIVSALVYLLQGWLIIIAARPVLRVVGGHCAAWLVAGGLAYTLGIVFFALDSRRYFHAAWHIFVLAGSIAHYFAILFYIVPSAHG
jgi:hemolysin III